MHATWTEQARWSWTGPHDYRHDVWIEAHTLDNTGEITSWCTLTRLGGPGSAPKQRYYTVEELGPEASRAAAFEVARAYRAEFGGPAD